MIYMNKIKILIQTAVLFLFLSTCLGGRCLAQSASDGKIVDAVSKYDDGDFSGAVSLLKDIIKGDPSNDGAEYYLGLSYVRLRNTAGAEESLKKAVALDSSNYWYRYSLARLYAMTGRSELTIDMYEKLLRDFPKKSDLYYELVDLYMKDSRPDKALETIEEIETLMGKNEATVMAKFNILRQQNKAEEAYKVLKEYNSEYSSPQVLSLLGDYEMGMFNDSTAIAYYNEALSIDKDFAIARLGKAEVYRMTRRYPEYFKEIDGIMADDDIPSDTKSHYLDAIVRNTDPRFLQSFTSQMDTAMSIALERNPADTSLLQTAGSYYFITQRRDLAKEAFRTSMEKNPDNLTAAVNYIQILGMLGEWDEEVEQSGKAFDRFGDVGFLQLAVGGLYNKGDYQGVIATSEKLLSKLTQKDTTLRLETMTNIGDMYQRLGESKKAFKCYEEVLKLNANYVPALNNYAYFLSEEGKDLKKAYKMSKKTIEAEPDNATYLDTFGWILHLMGRDIEAKPFFKQAMIHGGKESSTVLEHYAIVLEKLGENDLAAVYRSQAKTKRAEEEAAEKK